MTGINVLSTRGSTKGNEQGFSISEKNQLGSESATLEFAALLSSWLTQVSGQGQNSGYQSNEPAGKEANSGHNAILGWDGLQALIGAFQGYGNPLEAHEENLLGEIKKGDLESIRSEQPNQNTLAQVLLQVGLTQNSLVHSSTDGTVPSDLKALGSDTIDSPRAQTQDSRREATLLYLVDKLGDAFRLGKPEQSQGKNSPQSELDQYKALISNLLNDLSGKIQDNSENPNNLASIYPKLDIALQRINTGLFNPYEVELQPQSQVQPPTQTQIQTSHTYSSNSIASKMNGYADSVQSENNLAQGLIAGQAFSDKSVSAKAKGNREVASFLYQRELVNLTPPNQLDSTITRVSENNQNTQLITTQETIKPSETLLEGRTVSESIGEDLKPQDLVTEGLGVQSQAKENVQNSIRFESKTDIPIWAQVARDIHEKAFKTRPHIKELDIQLHPAELGQIRLSLTWEDGQVHLRMTASELGTGQMLQSNLNDLRDSLSQLGIQCGMLEMGLGGQQNNSGQHQAQQGEPQSKNTNGNSQGFQGLDKEETMSGSDLLQSNEARNQINVTA